MSLPKCWECENETDRLVVVLLHGPSAPVGRLTLCTACVSTRYAPLATDPELAVLISIQEELHLDC
jgi:hypothetical protein